MLKDFRFYVCSIGAIFILMFGCTTYAAPICPVPVEFTQPNGDVITVISYGDEFFSWQEDENGNIVAYDEESHSYKYAEIKENKIVTTPQNVKKNTTFKIFSNELFQHKIQREDIISLWENAERIDYSKTDENNKIQLMSTDEIQEISETKKLLTILIEFNDIQMKYDAEFWSKQMFDTTPNALSVVNYWKENANGLDVFEPVETSNIIVDRKGTTSYEDYIDINYEIKECSKGVVKILLNMPHPSPTGEEGKNGLDCAVNLAVRSIEKYFDFTEVQPYLVTIFSGYGPGIEQGTQEQGHIRAYTSVSGATTSDGTRLKHTVQPEMLYINVPAGIGIICHELGHSVFGLPVLIYW